MSEESTPVVESTESSSEPIVESSEAIEASSNESETSSEESSSSEPVEVQAETTEELKEEIEQAIEEGASEAEVESMIKEFELKVGGKTFKRKIDLSDEEAIKRELQMAMAGRQSMQEKAELEKEWLAGIEQLKNNPFAVMEDLGMDPLDAARSYLENYVQEKQKSPEQLAQEQMQKELEEFRKENEKLKLSQEKERFRKLQQEAEAELEKEIEEVFDAHKTLPRSPKTKMKLAESLLWAQKNGFPDARAIDVAPMVEDALKKEMQEFIQELPEDFFEAYLGKQNLDRYRKSFLPKKETPASINNIKESAEAVKAAEEAKKDAEPKKRAKAKDYFRNL